MRLSSKSERPGFTLLEVLLATAIGVLLMAALYVALDVQVSNMEAGRDIVHDSVLARSVLARITNDIKPCLGATPLPPPPSSSSSGPSTGGGGSGQGSSSSSSSSSSANSSSSASPSSSSTPAPTTASTNQAMVNVGVQGDSTHLVLTVSRLIPNWNPVAGANGLVDNPQITSDLKQITYWLAGSSGQPLGLARQEITAVPMNSGTSVQLPDGSDEASFILAEEIRDLQFSYFDGNTWQDSWDGTTLSSDGKSPIGPPLAIAIRVGIVSRGTASNGSSSTTDGPPLKYYRHVVSILTANSSAQPSTTNPTGTSSSP